MSQDVMRQVRVQRDAAGIEALYVEDREICYVTLTGELVLHNVPLTQEQAALVAPRLGLFARLGRLTNAGAADERRGDAAPHARTTDGR